MGNAQIKALLIDSDIETARSLREGLLRENISLFRTNCIDAAFRLLSNEKFDTILIDPAPFKGNPFDTVSRLLIEADEAQVIILTSAEDEKLELAAMRAGVQDCIVKGALSIKMLARSIKYGLERHQQIKALRCMSFTDELTGLYNRRGFLTAAEEYLNLAKRTNKSLQFVIADLDGLKKINDSYGHKEGDHAIVKTAEILKNTFRKSDIVARLGGDEFVMVAIDEKESVGDILISRLQENMQYYNSLEKRRYLLSISVGTTRYDPSSMHSIEEMMAKADVLLYEQKRNKKQIALAAA